ncbi:MAG: hypothetical protein ACK5X3_06965 [Pseudomonadota bacterium]
MIRPTRQGAGTARVVSIPPPVQGLNARDALASMDAADAITLDNWFPRGNDVVLRRGHQSHVTGLPGNVETLMQYSSGSANKLFAASGTAIYDVTTPGAVGAAVVSGLTNARWQHVVKTTSGGTFLVCCNGADAMRAYDGSTWTTPSITGVTSSNIIGLASHKERLWLIEKDSATAYYLATKAIAGNSTAFPLGAVFRMGGKVKAIIPLSQDAGSGPDDFLAFVSDKGEVAIYQGTDPGTASEWALIGVFRVGAPIGDRAFLRVGGDAALITDDGVISLLQAINVDRAAANTATITDRIRELFSSYVRSYRTNFGWQAISYPAGNWGLFNVPISATQSVQLVMNTITGAWCRFTGQNAFSWSMLGNEIYFGGSTRVFRADVGGTDNGADIQADMKTAFQYFKDRGGLKRFTMLRPVFLSNGAPVPRITLDVDFGNRDPIGSPSFTVFGALWDAAVWDADVWAADGEQVTQQWIGVHALGRCAAVRMKMTSQGATMAVSAFDVLMEPAQATAL